MAHITSFTVENFKRFEHFEMQNIGQFNLIVGDNNVGKTSVLEALLITKSAQVYVWRMQKVLKDFHNFTKPKQSYFTFFVNQNNPRWAEDTTIGFYCLPHYSVEIKVNQEAIRYGSFDWLCKDSSGRTIEEKLSADNTPSNYKYIMPYIPFGNGYKDDLAEIFQEVTFNSTVTEDKLKEDLKLMIPRLKDFRISTIHSEIPVIALSQKGVEPSLPFATFGDGAVKLFRILIEIIVHSGNRLMIDEIDSGVHIGHFRDFWRTILKAAITHDVQLFATTHNWECLEVFKEVLEEPEMQEFQARARCFTLIDSPVTKRVEAICSTFEQFETAVENGTELRGGAIV